VRVEVLVPALSFAFRIREGRAEPFRWAGEPLKAGEALFLVPNCVLIQTPERAVLVDPGPFLIGRLPAVLLAKRGISPEVIVNTHLHTDHAWGNVFFKGKTLVFHERELEEHPKEWVEYITSTNKVKLLQGEEGEIVPGVRFVLTGRHTPGHIAVLAGHCAITGDDEPPPLPPGTTVIPGHSEPFKI